MACFHVAVKSGRPGVAAAHSQYITREGKYSKGEKAEELVYKEHGNMPEWALANPQDFWRAADLYERANGRPYTGMELDLPQELSKEQQIELVQQFCHDQFQNDHAYSFAIHTKDAKLDPSQKNPHVHIMFSERKMDGIERNPEQFFKRANSKEPEKGGCKKERDWHRKDKPYEVRECWAKMQNLFLEKYNHDVRVDHRSLEDQKIEALAKGDFAKAEQLDRVPETHLGPADSRSDNENVRFVVACREHKKLLTAIAASRENIERQVQQVLNDGPDSKHRQEIGLRLKEIHTQIQQKALELHTMKEAKSQGHVVDIQSFKDLKQQIGTLSTEARDLLNERMLAGVELLKQRQQERQQSPIVAAEVKREIRLTSKEARAICDDRLSVINELLQQKQAELVELSKKVYSPERASVMAQSVFFKGADRNVRTEKRMIEKEKEKLTQLEQVFLSKPKPGFFQRLARKSYELENENLAKQKQALLDRDRVNTEQQLALDRELAQPNIQQRVTQIQQGILEKNAPQRGQVDLIKQEIKTLQSERTELYHLRTHLTQTIKQEINDKYRGKKADRQPDQTIHVPSPSGKGGNVTAQDLLRQANSVVKNISNERMVGLDARIEEEELRKDKDQGLGL